MPNWKKVITSGSDATLNSLTVTAGVTGSLYGTASYAINGGVTQIIAGTNVTISPTNGLGAVTINASGTGGSTDTGSLLVTASVSSNTITFTKGDGSTFPITISSGGSTDTGSLLVTASISNNIITFTKGDASTFTATILSSSFAQTASYVNTLSQNVIVNGFVTASAILVSGSGGNINRLLVIGSGSNIPLFTVQGSSGELFSITDSLTGSLFSVNDISGLPIIEAFSDGIVTLGNPTAPSLYTTVKVTSVAGNNTIYSIPTSSYDGAWFEYTIKSGSNARAGQLMSIWGNGGNVRFTETTTTDIGNTSGVAFTAILSGANLLITGSTSTANWTIKGIVRSI